LQQIYVISNVDIAAAHAQLSSRFEGVLGHTFATPYRPCGNLYLIAAAVRFKIERQLMAFGMLPVGAHVPCSVVWLACLPHQRLHRLIWDMVCLAALYASVDVALHGPCLISSMCQIWYSLLQQVLLSLLYFWEALADYCVTPAAQFPALSSVARARISAV
jgi:hypothetical protein